MAKLQVPHRYEPRDYQRPFWEAMARGKKRAILLWHRRGGKDKTCLNYMISQMVQRVGTYYYFLPTYAQGKKILWDGIDGTGMRFMDHFPPELVKSRHETELKVELATGSVFQIIGTDNYNSIMGTNPVGCVFSEYSLQDPKAWQFIQPILLENNGWAVFPYTPRGKNHGFKLYESVRDEDDWFVQKLTVRDTKREDGTPLVTEKQLDAIRREGTEEEIIQQEFYCAFTAGLSGAFFAKLMEMARNDGRVTRVPWEPKLEVGTAWDLGIGDATAIWFYQLAGREVRLIDYYENSGEGLTHYAAMMRTKPYVYMNRQIAPHDIEVRELISGRTRRDMARELGVNFRTIPKLKLEEYVEAARNLIPRCYFDASKCERGIDGLMTYRKRYDEKLQLYTAEPVHDWSSHPADAFKILAVGWRDNQGASTPPPRQAETQFDVFNYEGRREPSIWES